MASRAERERWLDLYKYAVELSSRRDLTPNEAAILFRAKFEDLPPIHEKKERDPNEGRRDP